MGPGRSLAELKELILPTVRMHGVVVGSRAAFEAMCRAMTLHQIRPVIDRVFPMVETRSAYQHLARAAHVRKVVIDVPGMS
jgi:D-arabinose 1-dehydrogenase-like Zn-dependent alcohol dehydrogenase